MELDMSELGKVIESKNTRKIREAIKADYKMYLETTSDEKEMDYYAKKRFIYRVKEYGYKREFVEEYQKLIK